MQILHLHSAGITFKFKMKVLAVCLMAAALVGMGASTTLENVAGETQDVVEVEGDGEDCDCEYHPGGCIIA